MDSPIDFGLIIFIFNYWRHRLAWPRTSGSQPEDQGSNPCGAIARKQY